MYEESVIFYSLMTEIFAIGLFSATIGIIPTECSLCNLFLEKYLADQHEHCCLKFHCQQIYVMSMPLTPSESFVQKNLFSNDIPTWNDPAAKVLGPGGPRW